MKYRKKPVVIEAIQWGGHNQREIESWMGNVIAVTQLDQLCISTLEGEMRANVGDWIIRGVKGEYYPCKPDIFDATYEAE